MISRVAFFTNKEEIEAYYGMKTRKEAIFEPSYNIAPGNQLPVITLNEDTKAQEIARVRWGHSNEAGTDGLTVYKGDLNDFLKTSRFKRCVVPLSGFYIWKKGDPNKQPFFVRMLNDSVMSAAGLFDKKNEIVTLITAESNTLIQPMSELMPLLLNRNLSAGWIDEKQSMDELLSKSENLFMLTDLSVLKVSKKVNDQKNDNPKLIQPIPK